MQLPVRFARHTAELGSGRFQGACSLRSSLPCSPWLHVRSFLVREVVEVGQTKGEVLWQRPDGELVGVKRSSFRPHLLAASAATGCGNSIFYPLTNLLHAYRLDPGCIVHQQSLPCGRSGHASLIARPTQPCCGPAAVGRMMLAPLWSQLTSTLCWGRHPLSDPRVRKRNAHNRVTYGRRWSFTQSCNVKRETPRETGRVLLMREKL